jgi:hypothetical protein
MAQKTNHAYGDDLLDAESPMNDLAEQMKIMRRPHRAERDERSGNKPALWRRPRVRRWRSASPTSAEQERRQIAHASRRNTYSPWACIIAPSSP